jgi:tetratricopeptide (TPR) repeat protein
MLDRSLLLAALTLALVAGPGSVVAKQPAPPRTLAGHDGPSPLRTCLAQTRQAPDHALESARAWEAKGGGAEARLCQAMALFEGGHDDDAATRLEALAAQVTPTQPGGAPSGAVIAADLLSQAGLAWVRAGKPERAEKAYTLALARRPDDADLLTGRGFARAGQERYWDAIADFDAAIKRAPKSADAWFFRAGAYKAVDNYEAAARDIDQALALAPDDSGTLLLHGNIAALTGHADIARADWTKVGKLAPDSADARAAAANLGRLDKDE